VKVETSGRFPEMDERTTNEESDDEERKGGGCDAQREGERDAD
jgi:hypothetical protein